MIEQTVAFPTYIPRDEIGRVHGVVDMPEYRWWYQHGNLSRDHGPARMWKKTRIAEWWIDNKFIISEVIQDSRFEKWLENK